MEKIDNFKIGKTYKGKCPFDFEKAIKLNPEKLKIKQPNINFKKTHYEIQIRLYRENFNNDKFSKQPFLKLDVYKFKETIRITISYSLRKWYYGKNSTRDFNHNTLMDCLNDLSRLLLVDVEDLLCFRIYKIELGITFKLPSNYKLLLANLSEHKEFKMYGQFNNFSTVYFNAIDLGIKCYDVLQKLLDCNQISKNVYTKLTSKYFFLRLELKINKRSGVEFANENMNTMMDLISNRNKIIKYWISKMDKIQVDEEISLELANSLKDLNPKDIKDFAANAHRERLTWAKLNALLDITIKDNPKKKYAVKKIFRQLQEKWSFAKTTSNKEIFKQIILSVK